jgi:OmpA-OmpF porin, OOP family
VRREIEARAPADVTLDLDLSAPRPVIAPYSLAFRLVPGGPATLTACSAETEEERDAILAAARAAGVEEAAECRLGLGAPSPDWGAAAVRGIEAVADLGGGSFALTDMDALLIGPADIDPETLAAAGAALAADLPRIFTLATRSAARLGDEGGEPAGYAPEFRAVLEPGGTVRLAGPLGDRSSQIAVLGFAEAIFGHARVSDTIVLDPQLPEGWPGRVLTGIEALALLEEGTLAVTGDTLSVSGRSLQEEAGREIEAFFSGRAAGPVIIDVAFDAEAALAAAIAERPPEEGCAEEVKAILAGEMILFESGSDRIDSASGDVLDAIAVALEACPAARFEVAGHTDSSGSASFNQRLSERRAAAVVEALAGRVEAQLAAVGHGPDRPVADNDTEEGRALNRRIEFSLLRDEDETADGDDGAEDVAGDPATQRQRQRQRRTARVPRSRWPEGWPRTRRGTTIRRRPGPARTRPTPGRARMQPMDRTEVTLVVAGALVLAVLLGWVLRGIFRGLNAGGRRARGAADLADRLHRSEESEARLRTVERELTAELAEVRRELAESLRRLDAARAEVDEIREAYRQAVGPRTGT